MNYYNFIKTIKTVTANNSLVNEFGEGDIYAHLNSGEHKYPCVFLTVQTVVPNNDMLTINGTLFYVDRMLTNNVNKNEIISNGITILSQIFQKLSEDTVVMDKVSSFTPFDEKFADICAGVFASFSATIPNDIICSDSEFEVRTIELNHNGIYDIIGYDKAIVAVEGGKWGQITGDINEQTDLIELVEGAVGDSCECVNAAKDEVLGAIGKIDRDTTDITKKLQQIIGANILQPNLQGITFADGYATDNVLDILLYDKRYMATITSESAKPIMGYAFYGCTSLTEANFPNATSIEENAFYGCTSLTEVNFPNAVTVSTGAFRGCSRLSKCVLPKMTQLFGVTFNSCSSLRYLDISSVAEFVMGAGSPFISCTNLIDIHIGSKITTNFNFASTSWSPTNAYSNMANNLVPADFREEHPEWMNRDYLLYCLREHFAANLPDRNGMSSLTITFNSTMKTHINNSAETAHAFTDKNYIIA